MDVTISNFYLFHPIESLEETKAFLTVEGKKLNLRALFILAAEGLNGTFSGTADDVVAFETLLEKRLGINGVMFKRSVASQHPFRKFVVKIRDEIVTTGEDIRVGNEGCTYISPGDWEAQYSSGSTPIVLDTRNDYEVSLGKFEGAIDLGLKNFSEFRDKVNQANIPRDRPILTYCTGGVRCEKAVPILHELGFTDVRQLEGGILAYLEQFPESNYRGECFVFDDRVAVDQGLRPTESFRFCASCGQPAPVAREECSKCRAE